MKVYSADSVKTALEKMEKRGKCSCNGLDGLVCPATHLLLEKEGGGMRKCNNAPPDKCPNALKRNCKRVIHVYNDKAKTRLYRTLSLYFTISGNSRKGYIDKDDNPLNKLIDRGDISVGDLVCLEI
ncbi:MAG: hypothetical protein LBB74_04680 [Chitinispirillales bacterium]|jgi:hypothetical protein|nr:hypothetical protein [Chitinispirillales bacterium]